jgi:hypothetical protein
MIATLHNIFDAPDTDHLDAATREADLAAWWQQQLTNARFALERPDLHTDDELRDACATLKTSHATATDECLADAMIWKLDERDRMRRHADARAATSRDVFWGMRERFSDIVFWGALIAVALLAGTGWL